MLGNFLLSYKSLSPKYKISCFDFQICVRNRKPTSQDIKNFHVYHKPLIRPVNFYMKCLGRTLVELFEC
jgi:hypothetical protein